MIIPKKLCLAFFLLASNSFAGTLYVDPSLGVNCLTDYNIGARNCNGGNSKAYADFESAISSASAGDNIILRGGNYNQLNINRSGVAGNPIKIKAATGESVKVSSSSVGLLFIRVSDVEVDGITVDNVQGFGRLEDAIRIHIKNTATQYFLKWLF